MNKMISPLSEAQIKKYKKLQDKAEENTQTLVTSLMSSITTTVILQKT